MPLSEMKDELHRKLWAAQERWFEWKEQGKSKHALKVEGLRDHNDLFARTRYVIFTGSTRVTYERELKRFVEYAHRERGKSSNQDIDKKDFRAYMEHRLEGGAAAKELNKVKSAIVKFGVLYGKAESFHAFSKKFGRRVQGMLRSGELSPPARPHVTSEVRDAVIRTLEELDRACSESRAYALAALLQKEASLRSIEATERFTRQSLLTLEDGKGRISVLGKGGRHREVGISRDLYLRIEDHFKRSCAERLADLRGYQQAVRRATLAVGGRATGTHAHRRTSATEMKNELYWKYAEEGAAPHEAREQAVADTVQHLGHSRWRRDSAKAYLS